MRQLFPGRCLRRSGGPSRIKPHLESDRSHSSLRSRWRTAIAKGGQARFILNRPSPRFAGGRSGYCSSLGRQTAINPLACLPSGSDQCWMSSEIWARAAVGIRSDAPVRS